MHKTINFNKVADIYDDYVKVDFDIPFFIQECEKVKGKILELMCGTGRVSIPVLEQGIPLTCVDYSTKMLQVFQGKVENKNYSVKLDEQDVSNLKLQGTFQLIYIPFHSFQEIICNMKQRETLLRIYNHLNEGGTFICTLQNPNIRLQNADGQLRIIDSFPLKDKKQKMILSFSNQYNKTEQMVNGFQFYEIFDSDNLLVSKRFLEIYFKILYKRDFETMAKDAGFKIETIYGNYDYSPFDEEKSPFMIWILKK